MTKLRSGRLVLAEWTGDGRLVPAATADAPASRPAAGAEMTVDDALARCGWRLAAAAGGCQIVDHGLVCGAETRWLISARQVKDAWICTRHYEPLAKLIATSWRKPG